MLHANCFFAQGYLRNCIYDLDRGTYHFVPKDVLVDGRMVSVPEKYESIIAQLKKEEVVFAIDDAIAFLFTDYNKLNTEPLDLHSIIIEVSSIESIKTLQSSLFSLLTIDHLVIYVKSALEIGVILFTLDYIKHFRIKSAILVVDFDFRDVEQIPKYTFLEKIIILNKHKKHTIQDKMSYMNTIEYRIKSNSKNNTLFFSRELFFESLHYNNYIHKKLIINANKEVVLSNIGEDSTMEPLFALNSVLSTADITRYLSHPKYTKLNSATKDQTLVCQNCELRYICVDKRQLYLSKSNKHWFHKAECSYNPYIAKWSDDKGYRTLKECDIYPEKGIVASEKLNSINQELWGIE